MVFAGFSQAFDAITRDHLHELFGQLVGSSEDEVGIFSLLSAGFRVDGEFGAVEAIGSSISSSSAVGGS